MDARTTVPHTGQTVAASPENIRKAIIASIVGTIIEWYDYAIYGAAAGLIINRLFFPNLDPATGALASFATFAVGFFARPVGGIVVAHIGDRFGRKPAMVLTIALMGFATVAIGLLPTYGQVGILAPVLLVLLRLVQGFGAGAELAGAVVLIAEYTPPSRRGFYTALPNSCTLVGVVLASLVFLGLSNVEEATLLGWAWRVPFLLSAVLFVLALYIRRQLEETPEYVVAREKARSARKESSVPIGELLRNSPIEVLFGFLSVTGQNAITYIINAFMLSYMVNTVHFTRAEGLQTVLAASVCGIAGIILFGHVSDRIGRGLVFALGAVFTLLFAFPLFYLVNTHSLGLAMLGCSTAYFVGLGAMTGPQGAFLSNLFPTRYRYSGLALSRELNGVLIAGPTPFIATWLIGQAGGRPDYVAAYLMACCLLTIIAVMVINKRSVHD